MRSNDPYRDRKENKLVEIFWLLALLIGLGLIGFAVMQVFTLIGGLLGSLFSILTSLSYTGLLINAILTSLFFWISVHTVKIYRESKVAKSVRDQVDGMTEKERLEAYSEVLNEGRSLDEKLENSDEKQYSKEFEGDRL